MKEGKPVQIKIRSLVAVDAAFFKEMRPNHSSPHIRDAWQKSSGTEIPGLGFLINQLKRKEGTYQKGMNLEQMTAYDFLVCCPTVRCFSFTEKAFGRSCGFDAGQS
jgi:hypothetical protein